MTHRVLIASPLYPPDIGGPSYYAKALTKELLVNEKVVDVVNFSTYRHLPSGVRHLAYLFALLRKGRETSFIIGFDVFSVGLPTVLAGFILRKPSILRVSGDFLWERSSEQGDPIPFRKFYKRRGDWGASEKVLFRIIGFTLRHASGLIFQNEWQRDILTRVYRLDHVPFALIRNSFPGVTPSPAPLKKNFLWAGRDMKLKNLARLKEACAQAKLTDPSIELEILPSLPQAELFERIRNAYAVINPSFSEMDPNIILEGVCFGKPFVCTRETGVGEVLQGAGIFVDPESTEEIRDAILDLAKPDVYAKFVRRIATLEITHTYADIVREILTFADSLDSKARP